MAYIPPKGVATGALNPNIPKNPYPDNPKAKFVNGKWIAPSATPTGPPGPLGPQGVKIKGKLGKYALAAYFASAGKKTGGKGSGDVAPDLTLPDQPGLTAYPDLQSLPDGTDVPDTKAQKFTRTQASLLDPKAYAKLEGMQAFKPLIDALTGQQSRLQGGIGQANSMMDSAYGDASATAYKGAQLVKDSNAQSNQSLTDLAARLAQVGGGDPTAAAAVGQTAANQEANDSRFAGVAEQAQSDQAEAAQRDLAIAKLGYKSATDSSISDLAEKIGSAKQAGSQAQGAAIKDALGFNSDQRTASLNRDVSTLEANTAAKLAAPQITAANLANAGSRQTLIGNKNNASISDWKNLNEATRNHYLDAVQKVTDKATVEQMKQALAQGKQPVAEMALADPAAYAAVSSDLDHLFRTSTGPIANPGVVFTQAVAQMRSQYGDSSPKAIRALAQRYVQGQLAAWNSEHAKGQDNSKMTWKMVNGAPALVKMKK